MTKNTAPNTPTQIVWFAPERDNAPWIRIGAVWPTRKEGVFRMSLELTPVAAGSIIIQPYEPKEAA